MEETELEKHKTMDRDFLVIHLDRDCFEREEDKKSGRREITTSSKRKRLFLSDYKKSGRREITASSKRKSVMPELVDNPNLFHEMKCYVGPDFRYEVDAPFNYLDGTEDDDNIFPDLE